MKTGQETKATACPLQTTINFEAGMGKHVTRPSTDFSNLSAFGGLALSGTVGFMSPRYTIMSLGRAS
jgi:hypothetical protein